jgi:hypothetical protein
VRRSVFGLLSALAVLSCGKGPPPAVDPMEAAYLEVQNQSFYDMTVYAIRSGMRIRMGIVSGNQTQVFPIPRSLVNQGLPLRFMADPIGGRQSPYSEEIAVRPGDTIVIRIPPT